MITLPPEAATKRLDKWLQNQFANLPFVQVQKLCRTGQVRLNGSRVKGNEKLGEGDTLRLPPQLQEVYDAQLQKGEPDKAHLFLTPNDRNSIQSWIVGETDDLVAINKPAGLPTQAGSGHVKSLDRMLNAFFGKGNIWPLHRLDKPTSGLIIFAKSAKAATDYGALFKGRKLQKTYLALTHGRMKYPKGVIDKHLIKARRETEKNERMHVANPEKYPDAQPAVTHFQVLQTRGPYQLQKVSPKTGRTHQIRCHLAFMRHPIVGDIKYGGERPDAGTCSEINMPEHAIFLHAYRLELPDGTTFEAPIPPYWDFVEMDKVAI